MSKDYIGAQTVEVPPGTSLSAFQDKVLLGLADYFSFWINENINAKLRVQSPTSPEGVPANNRFPWDPSTYFVQNRFPALYIWSGESSMVQFTSFHMGRRREIKLAYIFDEVTGPGGITARHGVIPAVEAAVMTGFWKGSHPDYSYDGDTAGTPIWETLNLLEAKWVSSEEGHMAPVPEIDARSNQGSGHVIRYYPALLAKFTIVEGLEDVMSAETDPDNLNGGGPLVLEISYALSSDNSSVTGGSAYSVDLDFKTINLPSYSAINA